MIEFITVPNATIAPYACACCGFGNPPFTDTHRELVGFGRVYVCSLCVKRLAKVNGLTRGKRQDELIKAAEREAEAQKEVDRHVDAETKLKDELIQARIDLEQTRADLAAERQNTEALAAKMRESAKEFASLAGIAQ